MMDGYDDSVVMGFGYWLGWLVGLFFLAIIVVLTVKIITHKQKLKKTGGKSSVESGSKRKAKNNNRPTP